MKSMEELIPQKSTKAVPSESTSEYENPNDEFTIPMESRPDQPEISQILDKLEPEDRKVMTTFMVRKSEHFSGPLPHPDHLKGYEECYPGAAKEILEMASSQMKHRQKMEERHITLQEKNLDSHYKHLGSGSVYGFILALTFLIGGISLIAFDKSISGFTLISAVIVGLVGMFVYNKKTENSDRKESESNPSEETE